MMSNFEVDFVVVLSQDDPPSTQAIADADRHLAEYMIPAIVGLLRVAPVNGEVSHLNPDQRGIKVVQREASPLFDRVYGSGPDMVNLGTEDRFMWDALCKLTVATGDVTITDRELDHLLRGLLTEYGSRHLGGQFLVSICHVKGVDDESEA